MMRNLILLIILSFLQTAVYGQTRSIRGIVYDNNTNAHIKGVKITPDFYGNDTTNKMGRFKVLLPKKYKDTIKFTHPDYYTYYQKINNSAPARILLIPRDVGIDTVFFPTLEECSKINGEVYDKVSHYKLQDAFILVPTGKAVAKTNQRGRFTVEIPRYTDSITVIHKDFDSINFCIKERYRRRTTMRIPMLRSSYSIYDSLWKANRNMVQGSPFELFNLGLGIRYSFFIKNNLAIGIHSTFYFQSLLSNLTLDNRYDGIKLAPFLKIYFYRNFDHGANIEFKAIGGFYNSDRILYHYDNMLERYEDDFWTAGFGVSIGHDWYIENNIDLSLSFGLQLFPNGAPQTIEINNLQYSRGDNSIFPLSNWYFAGPGSLLEIKFLIGSIF